MRSRFRLASEKRDWRRWFQLGVSAAVIVAALLLFVYPATIVGLLLFDGQLQQTGESRMTPMWFKSATPRFIAWADSYLDTKFGQSVAHDDIPATEWPMFGAVFYLVTAEDLHQRGAIDATRGAIRKGIEKAAEIVASPMSGTWVRTKWGDSYREKENVFYRMLLILGLSSYESLTGDRQYRELMSHQRTTLADELAKAKYHLRDDYPNECYPADMLWAVAAIQRAGKLEGMRHDALARDLMKTFDGPLKASEGLPAFQADSRSGGIQQGARGCGNSGLLIYAAELDLPVARKWYAAYETNFWKDLGWIAGFTEMPLNSAHKMMDVDSGPVLCDIGSVASAFGIGAAKTFGRADHAAPLTMQAVACSWPTPFGFLVPGFMGRVAAKSWSLGEVALLFSMTRPNRAETTVPFTGHAPGIVWLCFAGYLGLGTFFIGFEVRGIRRLLRRPTPIAVAQEVTA